MGYLLESKKFRSIGGPYLWGGIAGALIANHFGIDVYLISSVYLGGSLVVAAHMIAYGLSDAAGIAKSATSKEPLPHGKGCGCH